MLIDLATAAGASAGALIKIVGQCLQPRAGDQPCEFETGNGQPTAQFALVGAGLGLAAGWLLTRKYDSRRHPPARAQPPPPPLIPLPTVLPVPRPRRPPPRPPRASPPRAASDSDRAACAPEGESGRLRAE